MQAPCGASADESLYFGPGDGRQPASDACDLDALDRELAELDGQRAAVVRRALHAALALTEDAALGLAAARIFACPTPPLAMGGNARPGYAIAGPNLGSYALAVLAAEWAGVGLAQEDLHVQGRALALPSGSSGGCDVEEETLEEEAGAAAPAGAGAGQGLLAQEEEGERSEEDRDVWDTAAAAAAASLYCASGGGGGGGGGSPSRHSLWGWETPSSGSGTQRSASSASSPPQSSTPALASALASFSSCSGSGAGSCAGGGPSAATSQRGSPTAPPGRPHGLPGSGPTSRRTSAVLIPPPSFLAPAGLGLPMLRAQQHSSPQAPCTPASSGGSGRSTARGGAGGSSARPLSPGQLQVIGTRLWVGAGPPTREELATAHKGASRGKQ